MPDVRAAPIRLSLFFRVSSDIKMCLHCMHFVQRYMPPLSPPRRPCCSLRIALPLRCQSCCHLAAYIAAIFLFNAAANFAATRDNRVAELEARLVAADTHAKEAAASSSAKLAELADSLRERDRARSLPSPPPPACSKTIEQQSSIAA